MIVIHVCIRKIHSVITDLMKYSKNFIIGVGGRKLVSKEVVRLTVLSITFYKVILILKNWNNNVLDYIIINSRNYGRGSMFILIFES